MINYYSSELLILFIAIFLLKKLNLKYFKKLMYLTEIMKYIKLKCNICWLIFTSKIFIFDMINLCYLDELIKQTVNFI